MIYTNLCIVNVSNFGFQGSEFKYAENVEQWRHPRQCLGVEVTSFRLNCINYERLKLLSSYITGSEMGKS